MVGFVNKQTNKNNSKKPTQPKPTNQKKKPQQQTKPNKPLPSAGVSI